MKKKLFVLLMAGALGLTACGGAATGNAPEGEAASEGPVSEEIASEVNELESTMEQETGSESTAMEEGGADNQEAANTPDATSSATVNGGELSEERMELINALYAKQLNFSNGVATADIIPVDEVQELYDHYDSLEGMGIKEAPIMIREYAATDEVYFDYDTDFSIKWEKQTGNIIIEPTDVAEREDFKQKAHK